MSILADITSIVHRSEEELALQFEDACALLELEGADLFELLALANRVRESRMGSGVALCAVVNAKSGNCSEDCAFCAQSVHWRARTKTDNYPLLDAHKILSAAKEMERRGAERFGIVISGRSAPGIDTVEFDKILKAVKLVREHTSLGVCASLGTLSPAQALALKNAGVSMYHHNLETAESYFNKICTTHTYAERVNTVKVAKNAGMRVCSGGIIGLGETPAQRVELAFALKALDVDSVPINILTPIPGTPLEHAPPLPPLEVLKTVAVFRLILPNKIIKFGGGREANLRDLQALGMLAGANGLLIGNYLTTPGRSAEEDLRMIHDLGLEPGMDNRKY